MVKVHHEYTAVLTAFLSFAILNYQQLQKKMQKLAAISFLKNLYLHTVSPSESFMLKFTCAKTKESYLEMAVLFIENLVAFFSYEDLVWLFHLVSESFKKVYTKVMYSSPTIL